MVPGEVFGPLKLNAANWIGIDPDRITIKPKGDGKHFFKYVVTIQGEVQPGDGQAIAKFLQDATPAHITFDVEVEAI